MKLIMRQIIRLSFAASAFASTFGFCVTATAANADPLSAGDYSRTVIVDGLKRTYLVHVPKAYNPQKPSPVILALHGAAMNGSMMVWFTGLNTTSERENFIVVYPDGTGLGSFRTWNAGGFPGKLLENKSDDVSFMGKLLDDLETVATVDPKRVYACGMSNGAMMCYRLAAEMSDRIAAVAPVAGTIAIPESRPKRPVPVIHFHGTLDQLVPFSSPTTKPSYMKFMSAEESIQTWVKLDGCGSKPSVDTLSKDGDDMKVTRQTYSGGKDGAEVVLVTIEGGGHTWPGQKPPVEFIGKSAMNVSANNLIWEFFKKHPMN